MKLNELKEILPDVKTLNPEQIAKMHKVSVNHITAQLKVGIKVEHEHTKNSKLAREIALDHLKEDPNYYTHLTKMEKEAKVKG